MPTAAVFASPAVVMVSAVAAATLSTGSVPASRSAAANGGWVGIAATTCAGVVRPTSTATVSSSFAAS